MKVVFEVNEKSIALAKAVLLQATDSEEKERLVRDACSRCGNDMTVELNVAELDVEKARSIIGEPMGVNNFASMVLLRYYYDKCKEIEEKLKNYE